MEEKIKVECKECQYFKHYLEEEQGKIDNVIARRKNSIRNRLLAKCNGICKLKDSELIRFTMSDIKIIEATARVEEQNKYTT